MTVWGVFLAALVTDFATGLGALPLAFKRKGGRDWLGVSNGIAAGAMLAASAVLVLEGARQELGKTVVGALLGAAFMIGLRRLLHGHDIAWGKINSRDARRIFVVVAVMTLHSFTEGIGIGVSFGSGERLGAYITTAMAIHNIPEGLAISLIMVPGGASIGSAALWSIISSVPQPVMAIPAFLLVEHFRPLLAIGLGFAAGAMVWMVGFELIPESLRQTSLAKAAGAFVLAAAAMAALQFVLA